MNTQALGQADDDEAPGQQPALRPLTDKQRRFVEEYLVDMNGSQAAMRAGFSERTSHQAAHELMRRPNVAAAIVAAMEERSMRTKTDATWVLSKLRDMFEADVSDLYDRNGRLLPVKDWPKIWRTGGLVTGLESVETVDLAVDEADPATGKPRTRRTLVANKKIRWADRIKLLELIGKHVDVGAFRDLLGLAGGGGGGGAPSPAAPARPLASFTDEELEAQLHRRIALKNGSTGTTEPDGTPPANGHR